MDRIDSPRNPLVLDAVRSIEHGERVVLEGERMLAEALDAGVRPVALFAEPGADRGLLSRAARSGAAVHEASRRVVEKLSSLASPRGLVALSPLPQLAADDVPLPPDGLALYLDGIQDPVNVGAILRSAEAFGAAGALLSPGCASPYSARSMRASAGSALRLAVATRIAPAVAVAWARRRGATIAGAEAHGGVPPAGAPLRRPVLLVVGSEGRGVSAEMAPALDARITVPLGGRVESLNAAVAAGILLYALGPKPAASGA